MNRRLGILALGAYAALLVLVAPPWPDDWDGIGFVESIRAFDLARFQPHPPGYPVYVALLRGAAWLVRDPMRACILVAVASGVATVALVWGAVRSLAGERAAWLVAVFVGTAPLAWRAFTAVGSEAPALACVAACAWGLAPDNRGRRAGTLAVALGAAAGSGVRLSWAPLFLAAVLLVPRGRRLCTALVACAASLAWFVPLLLVVGPSRLVQLNAVHFAGHAQRWGGTVATEPGAIRLVWLARDVFVDGLGAGSDALGLAIAAFLAAAAAVAIVAWRRVGWRGWRVALVALAPYLLWIGLGQNLRDQPRHALPLVAALAMALALSARASRLTLGVVGGLIVLVATRTALDSRARRTIPPPGEQLVELARRQPAPDDLAVFGVSSVRFFETTELASHAFAAGALGDVEVRLTRLESLPSRVWVTSEVEGRAGSPWSLDRVATLCRPPRIDRRAPCLDVYAWKLPYLRR